MKKRIATMIVIIFIIFLALNSISLVSANMDNAIDDESNDIGITNNNDDNLMLTLDDDGDFRDIQEILDNQDDEIIYLNNHTFVNNGNGPIFVDRNISIYGGSSQDDDKFSTFDGENFTLIFYLGPSVSVTFKNINFINGNNVSGSEYFDGGAIYSYESNSINVVNCLFYNNIAPNGGAISIIGGLNTDLTVDNCTFENNAAINQIPDEDYFGKGGAIYYSGYEGNINILNSNFNNNEAITEFPTRSSESWGGAIYVSIMGNLTIFNSNFTNNSAIHKNPTKFCSADGGAIYSFAETLMISNCVFNNNEANIGDSRNSYGGAIYNGDSYKTDILNCAFNNNTASIGGAIYHFSFDNGNLTIDNSTFSENIATTQDVFEDRGGGAIATHTYGTILINNSLFKNNHAVIGGAYQGYLGFSIIDNSTFIDNIADQWGGAIVLNSQAIEYTNYISNSKFFNNSASFGGAILLPCSGLTVFNSTFIENNAFVDGGAIYFMCTDLYNEVIFSTFINNTANNEGGALWFEDGVFVCRLCWDSLEVSKRKAIVNYNIFDGNYASKGIDVYQHNNSYAADYSYNYWSMNFTTMDEFINSGLLVVADNNSCPPNWVLMSIYGNDPLKVFYNESFIATFDKVCTNESVISSFDGVLPDYWTSVYVYEGRLLTSNGLLGARIDSLLGAEADYNHEWDNENVDVGEFIANIWLKNNVGNFYFTPDKVIPYTFRTHSPFTIWEEAVFTTSAELPVADLLIIKTVSDKTVKVGDTVTWTITVTNNGPSTAVNAIVSDILSDLLTYVDSSASKGEYDSASGIWSVGNLTSGETVTLTITTIVGDVEGIVNNHVNVSSDTNDSDLSNNEDDENITVTKDPEQPDEPVIPDEPVEPVVPDEPDVPTKSDKPVKVIKSTGNPILMVLFALIVGGILFIRKKDK